MKPSPAKSQAAKKNPVQTPDVHRQKKDLLAMGNMMTEFLNSFVVMGYDFDGNAVCISNHHNAQEYNGLSVLVHDYMMGLHDQDMEG